ncbi:MAG: glycosyltransferase family 4 protein [Gemmatimonadota bacterium]
MSGITRELGGDGPLRVVIVAPSLQQLLGGQEVQGDQLVREWADDPEVRATLVASNPTLTGAFRFMERVPLLRTLLRLPVRATTLWRSTRDADVMHAFSGSHSSFTVATLPSLLVAWLQGKPSLVHYHSPRGEAHLAESFTARWLLRRIGAVVVPSEYLREGFARCGVPSLAIANVVDAVRFQPRGVPPTEPVVLSIRNFEPRYAVDDVIRAFALVKTTHPALRLLLAGSGPMEGELRALVRALDVPDVTFAGAMSRDAVGNLMTRATLLLNASLIDNMPVSILEAFAAGVPVVSSSAGGISTFARHDETALLADVGDVEMLARHVRSVLDDSALAQRLVAAAQREVARCSWAAVRPQWLLLYKRLAAERFSSDR